LDRPQTPPDAEFCLSDGGEDTPLAPTLALSLPPSWLPEALIESVDVEDLIMPTTEIVLQPVLEAYRLSERLRWEDAGDPEMRAVLESWIAWLRTYATGLEQVLREMADVDA
jgi:hypothetical protein